MISRRTLAMSSAVNDRLIGEHLYPVDILVGKGSEDLWENTTTYHASVIQQGASSQEYLLTSDGKRVKIGSSSVFLLPLYRSDPNRSLLVLRDPASEYSGLAVYLNNSWWSIEDILKTSNSLRDGLLPVESLGERIVLFVLNCLVFGGLEKGSEADPDVACFVAHSEREQAKILWQHGEAAAFYTVKPKGSLCDGCTSQWYMLPVLDTAFVRRSHRRRGHMTAMLLDFCQHFPADAALGLSCPVSADMYKVCQKFLQSHPEERDRLWEVEAPGDWCQRENIWLKIQLRRRDSAICESLKAASNQSSDHGGETESEETTGRSGCTRDTERLGVAPIFQKTSVSMSDADDVPAPMLHHHPEGDARQGSTSPCQKTHKRKLEDDEQGHSSVKFIKASTS